jgi:hypothetical protein
MICRIARVETSAGRSIQSIPKKVIGVMTMADGWLISGGRDIGHCGELISTEMRAKKTGPFCFTHTVRVLQVHAESLQPRFLARYCTVTRIFCDFISTVTCPPLLLHHQLKTHKTEQTPPVKVKILFDVRSLTSDCSHESTSAATDVRNHDVARGPAASAIHHTSHPPSCKSHSFELSDE